MTPTETMREWRRQNPERAAQWSAEYAKKNADRIAAYQKEYRAKNATKLREQEKARKGSPEALAKANEKARAQYPEKKAKIRAYQRSYAKLKPEKQRAYYEKKKPAIRVRHMKRYYADPHYRIRICVSSRMAEAIRNGSGLKSGRTLKLLGCTWLEFMAHMESQFKPGMTWQNFGEWHCDHKRPCASFRLDLPEEQAKCFFYKNLQPLWWWENLAKGDKIIDEIAA